MSSRSLQAANREQKRLYEFSVRVSIKRPQDPNAEGAIPSAKAASAPVAAKL
jgi:type IV pilus assembly protein PilN